MAALKAGDAAPDFDAQASFAGKASAYSLSEARKKGPVVVYFYPSAYTKGCNVQARAFADNHEKFAAAGASIIGVSLDGIARLNDFSSDPEYCNSKFPVASRRPWAACRPRPTCRKRSRQSRRSRPRRGSAGS